MILGFLIGAIQFPAFGAKVGLGNAGGLLVSGVIVSSLASRLRFFGNTPNAARNILEDLGLVVFVAIVGINAGNSLLAQLTGALALKIFLVGFIACTMPPIIVWAIGCHVFKINPAVLMGGVAGARCHSRPVPRGGEGDPVQRAVDRLPGRLRGVRHPADGVRLLRDAARPCRSIGPMAAWVEAFLGQVSGACGLSRRLRSATVIGGVKFKGIRPRPGDWLAVRRALLIGHFADVPVSGMAKSFLFLLFLFGIGYSVGPQFVQALQA